MRRIRTLSRLTILAATLAVSAATAMAQGAPPAPPVQVSAPLARKITLWDEYTGRFEAREQVEVRARVSGFIEKVHFRDGQLVNKGDLLFTIDRRPFQLSVDAARAEVERTKAQVALAENEVERADSLTRNQTITVRDLDRIDPGLVEGAHDLLDVCRVDAMPDRVHAVAQRDVLDVELGAHAGTPSVSRTASASAVRIAADVMMSRLPA